MNKTQKSKLKELSEMIIVRNHAFILINGPRTTLVNKEDVKRIQNFVTEIDKEVIQFILSLNYLDQDVLVKKDVDLTEAKVKMEQDKLPENKKNLALKKGIISRSINANKSEK